MIPLDLDQRSEAWQRVRLRIPTASRFDQIILPNGKPSGKARGYFSEILWQRLTGQSAARDLSRLPAVQYGIAHEDEAAIQFQMIEGKELARIGFCLSDDGRIGCSPDRIIVGANQGVEIKCPEGPTHISNLLAPLAVPVAGSDPLEKYFAQLQGQILICGFDCVHLFSYRPEAPPFLITSQPDLAFLSKLEGLLRQFCDALDRYEEILRHMGEWRRLPNDPLPDWPQEESE
jgi:hypothetical protein